MLNLDPISLTTTTLLLTQTSFFALGNSNAISSIDLSTSYNGISGYNVTLVGILLFVSNWAGPIYFTAVGILLLGGHGGAQSTRRHIATSELDDRDWVREERAHLERMARQEQIVEERKTEGGGWKVWSEHVGLMTLWTGMSIASVMLACTVLRQHLFIWTVFSPKFLFAMAWGIGFHFAATIGLGGLLWGVGRW